MDTQAHIKQLIDSHAVLLFMKGTKFRPMCGFSMRTSNVLAHIGVAYETVNILDDDELRAGLKEYSNWPTFPQLYVDGQLVGGSDIVMEMYENGGLAKMLENHPKDAGTN